MSLNALGIAANIFGVVTPAKDIGEIIKGIADSVQEVKANEESTSYWDNTLQEHAKEVYHFMIQCGVAGASEQQIRSLHKLFVSLNVLRKEVIENGRRSYLTKLLASGDIGKKIERVERKMKHCQDLFFVGALSTHTDMLIQMNKEVRKIANRDGRSYPVESTVIRWKIPGKADSNDPMAFEYAYLEKKSHMLITELKSNSEYIQERLPDTGHDIEILGFIHVYYPEGNPLSELDSAACRTLRSSEMLRARSFDDASFIEWLIDNEELGASLHMVGLTKEARQIEEFMCQMWLFLASQRGTAPIFSRLAHSFSCLAVLYSDEGRHAEALSHIEQAIRIYRGLGDSFLLDLARCLSDRSLSLRFLGRFEDSLESAEESVGIWRRLVDDGLSLYGPDLVQSLGRQAEALIWLSQYEEALQCSLDALQWLSEASPRYKQIHAFHYAWVSWIIAESHHNLGDLEQAKEYGRRALSVYHAFLRDRPLYYSHNLSYTLRYSSWFDHESALTVLDESLTACLTVDPTFTTPELADILDRRAAALTSSSRCAEALESYDQAISVRRRLLEDGEGRDPWHFVVLLKSFRLRASCLLSLHRRKDALSSLDAAQEAIGSRLKTEIDKDIKAFIIRELEEERKLMEGCTGPDYIELINSLRSCKKVLSQIQEVKCTCRFGSTARLDLGILSTLEHWIHMMAGSLDLALLSIQDAVDFYRSQNKQNRTWSIRADLVTSLVLHTSCCIRMDRLEQALCSMNDAVDILRVDVNHDNERGQYLLFNVLDLYPPISHRLLYEYGSHKKLSVFLEAAIEILRLAIMTNDIRTKPALAWMLNDKGQLLYNLGSYVEAISVYEECVDILRKLLAEDEWHKWSFAFSLYWLAKSRLATGNGTAAWTTVVEGINTIIEEEDPYCISVILQNLIFLRGDILFYLGRTPDVHDALLESLLLEIDMDADPDGGDDCESDTFSESGSEHDDESESESAYVSAVDDSDSDDSSGRLVAS